MKRYQSPFLENEKRKSDRRKDSISDALQPIMSAFIKYLEVMSETLEHKIEVETKNAETMLKFFDNLSNIKFHVEGLPTQAIRRERSKKPDNEHHEKVREIILSMRKNNKTYQKIADQLEKDSIRTFSGRGKWHAQTVHQLYVEYGEIV